MATKEELAQEIKAIQPELFPIFSKIAGLYKRIDEMEKDIRKLSSKEVEG